MDVDLDINNYSFSDILNLFKITPNYTEKELTNCNLLTEKIKPSNSGLDIKYYNLFKKALDEITKHYNNKRNTQSLDAKLAADVNNSSSIKPFLSNTIESNQNDYNFTNTEITENQYLYNSFDSKLSLGNSCYTPPNLYSTQLVTIHTEDRDILKYPYGNSFEVQLPLVIKNVLSIELFDIKLPTYYYNISEYLQNNTLWFSLPDLFNYPVQIIVNDGNYTPENLAITLKKLLNQKTSETLIDIGAYLKFTSEYTSFDVSYNVNENAFYFYNSDDDFILHFNIKGNYNNCHFTCQNMLSNWGISYNLGFFQNVYDSSYNESIKQFYISSSLLVNLCGFNTIYMEIEKYNWINEIVPYSTQSTNIYNNDYSSLVNGSFAKLILSDINNNYVPVNKFIRVLPHIEGSISKLKFLFRYHNGIPVDFGLQNFTFALKFECRFNCKY